METLNIHKLNKTGLNPGTLATSTNHLICEPHGMYRFSANLLYHLFSYTNNSPCGFICNNQKSIIRMALNANLRYLR